MSHTRNPNRGVDVRIENHGSIFLLLPVTQAAKAWLEENVDPESQWWCGKLVVEHRYIRPLSRGLYDAGFILK